MACNIPVSYLFLFDQADEALRKTYWAEFAANGARYLVLTAPLISRMLENPDLQYQLPAELAAEGLKFKDSHAPYGIHYDLNCTFEAERKSLLLRHKLHINIAAMLGVDTMTIHVGTDHLFPGVTFEQHLSRACSMLEPLLVEAEKCGVILALENGWTQTTSTDTLLMLQKKFACDNLGFCFDSGHANIMDNGRLYDQGAAWTRWQAIGIDTPPWESAAEKLQRMLPHVVNCHLHDNNGCEDQHRLPGLGNVDWRAVTGLLQQAPRLRVIQSEVHHFRLPLSIHELVNKFEQLFS